MGGDLALPHCFCEEYFVYPSAGAAAVPHAGDRSLADGVGGARVSAEDPGGDFCLHIVHRPVYAVAASDVDPTPPAPQIRLASGLTGPAGLDHPPRSL